MTSEQGSEFSAGVRRRIQLTLAANGFGQSVTVGSQLVLTPLFFATWGAEKYGEWLLISSIPAYLAMADLGIGSAAGNEMTMRSGAGDKAGARETFYSASWIAALAGVATVFLGVLFATISLAYSIPETAKIGSLEVAALLVIFALIVGAGFFGGVLSAGYRCCGLNAQGTALTNISRLFESVVMGAMLALGNEPYVVCLSFLLVRLLFTAAQSAILRKVCPWLFGNRSGIDREIIRRLMRPSLGFLAFPLGNALMLQGPLIILGWALGGTAVATFSSLRTLTRISSQVATAFNSSIWPELSLAYGAGDFALLQNLHRRSWFWTLLLSFFASVVLFAFGQQIAALWLGPEGIFNAYLFGTLLLASCTSAIWNVSAVVLTAINAHARMGAFYVLTNLCCISVATLLVSYAGATAVASLVLLSELLMLLWVFPKVIIVTRDSPHGLLTFCTKYFLQNGRPQT